MRIPELRRTAIEILLPEGILLHDKFFVLFASPYGVTRARRSKDMHYYQGGIKHSKSEQKGNSG